MQCMPHWDHPHPPEDDYMKSPSPTSGAEAKHCLCLQCLNTCTIPLQVVEFTESQGLLLILSSLLLERYYSVCIK